MEAVRPATTDDRARLRELVADLVADLLDQRGGSLLFDSASSDSDDSDASDVADRLAGSVGSPGRLVLVGTLEGVVTGFTCGHVTERAHRARRGVLDACYVEPAARGMGLGQLLLEAALAWFEDQGVEGIDGTALPGDRQAKNFFEAAGFKARMLTMYRPGR
jgi:GNAT superfamily N-acetyltransferase